MQELGIPIIKKTYDLYKQLHIIRNKIPKQDRYSVYLKTEEYLLKVFECILNASQLGKSEKIPSLREASSNLNLLKFFVRLIKDVKTIDNKNYILIEAQINEIGCMLGDWIKSTQS
jgi:hypothetical protein